MSMQKEFWIKNMVCSRCLTVIKQELEKLKVIILSLELGKLIVKTDKNINPTLLSSIFKVLQSNGFEIVQNEDEMLIEKIKIILIELLVDLPLSIKVNISELLSSLLHREYKTLSKLFSKKEKTTIEKYFIKLKIEKAKELIQLKQYSFSDIAYQLDYSSINHLSRQFREIIGMSMTDYKNSESWERKFYDEII
jgi:AraC-like DNA-binding protein